jgi:GDP-L-fucose synthase
LVREPPISKGTTMSILILGHTGFVGKNLKRFLTDKGFEVRGLSKNECDLRDYDAFSDRIREMGNIDVIFNCAANVGSVHYVTEKAADVIADNSLMALNLYKGVHELSPNTKIVNLLSNCCYANGTEIQDETKWLNGDVHPSVFSFGNFKRVLYYVSRCYEQQYDIKSVNLMFSGIYGPGDSTDPNKVHALNGMIIRMLDSLKNNDAKFEIWGTGSPIREWIYIEDVCKILLQSTEMDKLIEPVNVAQGTGFTIAETAQCIQRAVGYEGELTFNTDYQDGAPIKILGMGQFENLFQGYTFSNHQTGVDATVEYYKEILG